MRFVLDWLTGVYLWWIDRPLKSGTVLADRYQIQRVLGMGSYGISYLCLDLRTGLLCVVKQVRPSKKGSQKGEPIYEYETSLLATLDHPAIPQLLGTFRDKGQLFFAMEYMEGKNLEDLLFEEDRAYTEHDALLVIREVLGIVAYLHQRRIIHRDLRIPNVILAKGRLCLIDFGLARYLGDKPTAIAEDLGDYQLEKQLKREIAYKSDFYSLGHFLLFLLYSTYQEQEDAEERSWEEELSLSPATVRLLRRMLQIDPPYRDIEELQSELNTALEQCVLRT